MMILFSEKRKFAAGQAASPGLTCVQSDHAMELPNGRMSRRDQRRANRGWRSPAQTQATDRAPMRFVRGSMGVTPTPGKVTNFRTGRSKARNLQDSDGQSSSEAVCVEWSAPDESLLKHVCSTFAGVDPKCYFTE